MTSDEIRKKEWDESESDEVTPEDFKCYMLREIAAQLAELNAHFRMVDGND